MEPRRSNLQTGPRRVFDADRLSGIREDLRYAARRLVRAPGISLAATLTVGLGIGAATTIFGVVAPILLQPMPFQDVDRLVALRQYSASCPGCSTIAPAPFLRVAAGTRGFADAGAATWWSPALRGADRTEVVRAGRVTPGFFRLLGVPTVLGRDISHEDELAGNRVVVLGEELWRTRFGADRGIAGTAVVLDGETYTVVGVVASRYAFPPQAQLWTPLALAAQQSDEWLVTNLVGVGRLRDGVDLRRAESEVAELGRRLADADDFRGMRLGVMPLSAWNGGARWQALVVLAAVAVLLLVVCVNLAGLLLARALERGREIATRAAIGAGRLRIIRQLLTESVLLALLGGAVGAVLAFWAVPTLHAAVPARLASSIPGWTGVGVDERVLGFAFLVSVVAGLLFGIAPALHLSRPDLVRLLREDAGGVTLGRRRRRLGSVLAVAQLALAVVLLASAGLLLRSVVRQSAADPGFRTDGILTMELRLPPYQQRRMTPAEFHATLIARLDANAGVESAAVATALPLGGSSPSHIFNVEGRPLLSAGEAPSARLQTVSPGYFATLGIPLISGRDFEHRDREGARPVAIINRTLARRFFPDQDPIGRGLLVGDQRYEVIGVVGDVFHQGVHRPAGPAIYRAQAQFPQRDVALAIRVPGQVQGTSALVLRVIRDIDPDVATNRITSMDELTAEAMAPARILVGLFAAFAFLALVIAGTGLYGTISYAATMRTREFGVRLALGARHRDLRAEVRRDGLRLAGVGLAIGIAGALAAGRALSTMLYDTPVTDFRTLSGVAVFVGLVGFFAAHVPARKVRRLDPAAALRVE